MRSDLYAGEDLQCKAWERYIESELGLREYWYPVLFSHEIAEGGMRAHVVLGERVFLKRVRGTVYGVEDRCVHRGVAFSRRPECYTANTITCWAHGFTYDVRDGNLVQVISQPGCPLIDKVALRTYPTRELNGVIFVYIGDASPPPLEENVPPRFLESEAAYHPVLRCELRGNWRHGAENTLDGAHLYGHRKAALLQKSPVPVSLSNYSSSRDKIRVIDEPGAARGIVRHDDVGVLGAEIEGVQIRAANYPSDAPAVVEDLPVTLELGNFMPCGFQIAPFPRPGMTLFEWYTSIDEDSHMYFIVIAGAVDGEDARQRFHEECRAKWAPLLWQDDGASFEGFNDFDRFFESTSTVYY